jgi:hypothetical protein
VTPGAFKKLRQVVVFRVSQNNREVTTHHHFAAKFRISVYKPPEIRVHFRCAAGKVYRFNLSLACKASRQGLHRFPRHDLFAVGAGIHVAVAANLVTHFAHVNLQHLRTTGFSGNKLAAASFRRKFGNWWPSAVLL